MVTQFISDIFTCCTWCFILVLNTTVPHPHEDYTFKIIFIYYEYVLE